MRFALYILGGVMFLVVVSGSWVLVTGRVASSPSDIIKVAVISLAAAVVGIICVRVGQGEGRRNQSGRGEMT